MTDLYEEVELNYYSRLCHGRWRLADEHNLLAFIPASFFANRFGDWEDSCNFAIFTLDVVVKKTTRIKVAGLRFCCNFEDDCTF
ncbi:hypothetical protein [Novipirellula artificiosorum]|uniref:hypothetical protein n=1 Tax=Novipirellula artificiosorum TaxID=2528016 RepID=UPI0011B4B153|nr:hypothetical protein [Novipirellula artificiosorum]